MSECNILEKKLPAFVEGVLTEAEGREMMKHLEACDHCRAVLEDLKKTGDLLAGLEEKEPPPFFSQRVMARVREEGEPQKGLLRKLFFPLRVKVPLEVMATLLVAVLAWQVYKAAPPEMKALPQAPTSSLTLPKEPAPEPSEKEAAPVSPPSVKEKRARGTAGLQPKDELPLRTLEANEGKKQEEAFTVAQPAEAPATGERKKAVLDRAETPPRTVMEPLKKAEPMKVEPQAAPAPAPVPKAAPSRLERELREKDEGGKQTSEAAKERVQVLGLAAKGGTLPIWTVRVRGAAPASEKVREWLRQAGAQEIREEEESGRRIVSGRIGLEKLDGVIERLRTLGEVSPGERPAPGLGEFLLFRVEIIQLVP
jgi:hypothetical protein